MFRKYSNFMPLSSLFVEPKNPLFRCIVDQFDSKDFNKNDAGWIRNDISQLARATSQAQYDAIMKRLVELKQEGGLSDDVTIEEAISRIKPRYAQSPNEIEDFIRMTNGSFMEKLDEAYKKAMKDVKVTQPDVETSSSASPDSPDVESTSV